MKSYNRVMAGQQSVYSDRCYKEGFIGVDYGIREDLTGRLPDNWREFNKEFRPIYLEKHPGKSAIAAGLACGFTWTMSKGLKEGDVIITPNGSGRYRAGEITGPYYYVPDDILPHRRSITWYSDLFDRADMSEALQRSTNSTGTCCDITGYAEELEKLIGGRAVKPDIIVSDETVEDPSVFALEKHLEDFLVANWQYTDLGKNYDIYSEDGEVKGQQYPSDTGPIDILAVSKDQKEILIIELKRGRASDVVVGQIQRYMGYAMDELAEPHQTVRGVIIALEDDLKLRRALRAATNIDFYRYKVSFQLLKDS
ncbi:endonuclease NucS domain-containing protein [Pelagicoccus enzymogenes]|nr:endonuclease NucS domain-containing protein [Pelagicoccus enzymogenes]